jgi:hypothetical protein
VVKSARNVVTGNSQCKFARHNGANPVFGMEVSNPRRDKHEWHDGVTAHDVWLGGGMTTTTQLATVAG